MRISALSALAAAAALWTAPWDASAATFLLEGQIDADDYVISLAIPGPSAGVRTTFEFTWSGGVPDGGEVYWVGDSNRVERFNGQIYYRDIDVVVGCAFAFAELFPGSCSAQGSYAGATAFSFSTTPTSIRATFRPTADFDNCHLGREGVCAVSTGFRAGQFTAFFVGATTYRVTVTSTVVPEPGAWALMIIGIGAIGSRLRLTKRGSRRQSRERLSPTSPPPIQ